MTDNLNRFREFMQLPEQEGGDAYYVIELVRRGKNCPDLPAANYHFKNYYIDTLAKYDKVQDEIRLLCRTLRLRAYVSVCRKSFRRVTMNTLAEMARRAALDDFRRPYAVFESCSGKDVGKDGKYWVVDIDGDGIFDIPVPLDRHIQHHSGIQGVFSGGQLHQFLHFRGFPAGRQRISRTD